MKMKRKKVSINFKAVVHGFLGILRDENYELINDMFINVSIIGCRMSLIMHVTFSFGK